PGVVGAAPRLPGESPGLAAVDEGWCVVLELLEGRADVVAQGLEPGACARLVRLDNQGIEPARRRRRHGALWRMLRRGLGPEFHERTRPFRTIQLFSSITANFEVPIDGQHGTGAARHTDSNWESVGLTQSLTQCHGAGHGHVERAQIVT